MPMRDAADVIGLASDLVRADTVREAMGERQTLDRVKSLLEQGGFTCHLQNYDPEHPDRVNLLARLNPGASGEALLFGGHIDTVPFGDAAWASSPLSGEVRDGKLLGRGSCDMKGGVAAMVSACLMMADAVGRRDLILHIYGGEEEGCKGSFFAMNSGTDLGRVGAAVIAEPTGNLPLAGHKGALWLRVESSGRTSHASMPEQGENALAKLLPAACLLLDYAPRAEHPELGLCTSVLSTLHAGSNSNSVPDKAHLTMDMRTVPGQDHAAMTAEIKDLIRQAGGLARVEVTLDLDPVWTDPDHPWTVQVRRLLTPFLGFEPGVRAVQYFTDGGAVRRAFSEVPILICGPGDPAMAHKTDEFCPVAQIEQARDMYKAIIADWYGLEGRA